MAALERSAINHDNPVSRLEKTDQTLTEVPDLTTCGACYGAQMEDNQMLAGELYTARRAVDECFGMSGFVSSPAWDIVLDLFHNEQRGKAVSVTSACIGAACPGTTALRWLQVLESMSLVERRDDPKDKRRTYVVLTPMGRGSTIEAMKARASF